MKTKILFTLTALSTLIFIGCQTDGVNPFFKKEPVLVRPAQTNEVAVTATNFVPVINLVTNDATGEVTSETILVPQITTTIQPVVLPAVYYTNLALTPLSSSTVQTVGTAATVAGVPFGQAIAGGLLALSTVAFGFLNNRNRKKALENQSAFDDALTAAVTLVENFETLRQTALTIPGYTPQIDAKVMQAVQIAQQLAGVKGQINDIVDEKTGYTRSEVKPAA